MKRKKMLSKVCDRCGNDFAGGSYIIHLPYIKKYIRLCGVCVKGLIVRKGKKELSTSSYIKFWDEEY